MKILCIGNSFSSDATRYLYGVARATGVKLKVANLYIGGCSLYRHYRNMLSGENAYLFELNGASSGLYVSLSRALLSDEWDVVTLQQASHESPEASTYEPFLSELAAFVRRYAPKAKLWIHETWAYESGCSRLATHAHCESSEEMLRRLRENYRRAGETVSAAGTIPSGEAMHLLEERLAPLGKKAHRDTFHASYGTGRYTLALTWLYALKGVLPECRAYTDFDEPVSDEEAEIALDVARYAVEHFNDET